MATFAHSRSHTTPSPPPGIRTPPTPKHGYSDAWEPYSPRKSARISSQRDRVSSNRTPSPRSSHRTHLASPRTAKKSNGQAAAAMVSPTASPQKKRLPAMDSTRRSSGSLTVEGTVNAAAVLGLDKSEHRSASASITRRSGMLPTPAKTPKKAPADKNAASIRAIARNLFPAEEEVMPSPKKKRAPKKYSGISMESFTAEDVQDPIQIFTDSHDRVPKVDESEDNPFYGESAAPAQPEPTKRRSKRKVAIPGEASQPIEEAVRREDGIVYVFRGKKHFRKFAENDRDDLDEETTGTSESSRHKPLTRSSIKPRLLFQATPKGKEAITSTLEDEEAVTDVEDHQMEDTEAEAEVDAPQTPTDNVDSLLATPQAPKFGPATTPPDTKRTTRAGVKFEESTPLKSKGRQSPFDEWRRGKSHHDGTATKRQGESLTPSAPKRARA